MKNYYRKTAPKVKTGTVRKKNRWDATPNYYNTPLAYPVFDKEKPGRGYVHLIKRKELSRFVSIVPEWDILSKGLNAVVLTSGDNDGMGWCHKGVIGICAWERKIVWDDCEPDFFQNHKRLFDKLGVPCWKSNGNYHVEFDRETAKAFQLVHVLVHELGHHHDRMTTKSKKRTARGESYAEAYAGKYENAIIDRYFGVFGK